MASYTQTKDKTPAIEVICQPPEDSLNDLNFQKTDLEVDQNRDIFLRKELYAAERALLEMGLRGSTTQSIGLIRTKSSDNRSEIFFIPDKKKSAALVAAAVAHGWSKLDEKNVPQVSSDLAARKLRQLLHRLSKRHSPHTELLILGPLTREHEPATTSKANRYLVPQQTSTRLSRFFAPLLAANREDITMVVAATMLTSATITKTFKPRYFGEKQSLSPPRGLGEDGFSHVLVTFKSGKVELRWMQGKKWVAERIPRESAIASTAKHAYQIKTNISLRTYLSNVCVSQSEYAANPRDFALVTFPPSQAEEPACMYAVSRRELKVRQLLADQPGTVWIDLHPDDQGRINVFGIKARTQGNRGLHRCVIQDGKCTVSPIAIGKKEIGNRPAGPRIGSGDFGITWWSPASSSQMGTRKELNGRAVGLISMDHQQRIADLTEKIAWYKEMYEGRVALLEVMLPNTRRRADVVSMEPRLSIDSAEEPSLKVIEAKSGRRFLTEGFYEQVRSYAAAFNIWYHVSSSELFALLLPPKGDPRRDSLEEVAGPCVLLTAPAPKAKTPPELLANYLRAAAASAPDNLEEVLQNCENTLMSIILHRIRYAVGEERYQNITSNLHDTSILTHLTYGDLEKMAESTNDGKNSEMTLAQALVAGHQTLAPIVPFSSLNNVAWRWQAEAGIRNGRYVRIKIVSQPETTKKRIRTSNGVEDFIAELDNKHLQRGPQLLAGLQHLNQFKETILAQENPDPSLMAICLSIMKAATKMLFPDISAQSTSPQSWDPFIAQLLADSPIRPTRDKFIRACRQLSNAVAQAATNVHSSGKDDIIARYLTLLLSTLHVEEKD